MIQGAAANSSVEGLVIRAGTNPPLTLANSRLELLGMGQTRIARTDSLGRFAFTGIPSGTYTLSVTRDGYLRKVPAIKVDLKLNQAIKDVVLRLDPAPTIEGMIRDPEGNPILNATVQALRITFDTRGRRGLSLFASTRTDDRGVFRLYWLDPGDYFLSATAPPAAAGSTVSGVLVPTYFPGFSDIDDAKPIRLDLGRDAAGMDFALVRQAPMNLTGYVTSRSMGKGVVTAIEVAPPSDGAGVTRYQGQSGSLGRFTIRGVVPGTYIVSATVGEETFATRIRVRNSESRSREFPVDLPIGTGVTISGRVGNATQTPMDLRDARIQLTEIDNALPQPRAATIGPTASSPSLPFSRALIP